MIVMQCITANVHQIMTYGITRDSLGKIQLLSTGWRLQRYANTDTRSSILKNISPVERNVAKWTEELIGMYDCYKPDFNCFEYNFLKFPVFLS